MSKYTFGVNMINATSILVLAGMVTGVLLGFFFAKKGFDMSKTLLYSVSVAIGASILVGLVTGGLWSIVLLIMLTMLLLFIAPAGYYIVKKGDIEGLVNVIVGGGLLASGGIPLVALIILAVLGGIFIVTLIMVLFNSILFFIKFGLPLIIGAVIGRIVFELIGA